MEMTRLSLPAVCDLAATKPLAELLAALQTGHVELDGSGVERISTPGAQALAAARFAYASKGFQLTISEPSEAMVLALVELGLGAAVLEDRAL